MRIIILDLIIHLYLLLLSQLLQNDISFLLLNHLLLNSQKNRLIHLIFIYSTITKIHIDHLEIKDIHVTSIITIRSTQYSLEDNRIIYNKSYSTINLYHQSIYIIYIQIQKS